MDLITTKEAAAIIGCLPRSVKTLCQRGKLPGARKVGRDWLIPRVSAENYTPGPKGFAARPRAPTIPSEWLDILPLQPAPKNRI